MQKTKAFVLLVLLLSGILSGCTLYEKHAKFRNTIAVKQAENQISKDKAASGKESMPIVDDELLKKLYIGEAFKSGYIYIEPFSVDRGVSNAEVGLDNYPNTIKFHPVDSSENTDFYDAVFDAKFNTYIPQTEEDSKYFLQPASQPSQFGLCYKTSAAPEAPQLGMVIFDHEITIKDSSVKGKARPYSESEYKDALEKVKKDSEIKQSERTLDYITIDNTIIGAQQICVFYIEELQLEILLSRYNTHSIEYAGTVYVVDLIKDGQVIQTYKKHNWDGPY